MDAAKAPDTVHAETGAAAPLPEFGKYRAVREIGRGATSVVYLAEEIVAGRTMADAEAPSSENPFPNLNWSEEPLKPGRVAVKLVDFTDDGSKLARRFRKLFATEAAVSSQLDHPNITRVFDWKVEDNRAYLVMEYLEGDTLDHFVTMDKLLPMHRTVGVIFKVAMALDYAHRRGIVNRDIKPANIMLLKDDEVKVMDFGLALNIKKNVNVDSTFINGLGSPSYMSPEQIKGYTLNHQTDLYSLGVMFYQLLTGRLPFRATSTASLIYKIVNMEAVPVTQLNPDIPELTNKVITKAMEKDLYSRYRLGADMAKDLSAVRYQILEEDQVVPNEDRWRAIRGLPILGKLDNTDIWELLRLSHWRDVPPATVLFREGEEGKSFGFVLDGEVEIEKGRRALANASRGDLLGVMEWLDSEGATRSLSATTLTRVIYLEVNPAAFAFASEELTTEIRRLATDAMLKSVRGAMLLAKRVSPLAVHPTEDQDDELDAAQAALAAASANQSGWGTFADVPASEPAPSLPVEAREGPAVALSPSEQARQTQVVVQRMPAAAAAAIAQIALGRAEATAGQAFKLDETSSTEFVPTPMLPQEEVAESSHQLTTSVDDLPSDAVLTTEMAPNYAATSAMATTEMAPNFMSTTAMDDPSHADAPLAPSEVAPHFDVHQGSETSEMAPNFAGTTAFNAADFLPTPPLSFPPPARRESSVPEAAPEDGGALTTELAPAYAATTAFDAADFAPPAAPVERSEVAAAPEFDPEKTVMLSGGFDGEAAEAKGFTQGLYAQPGSVGAATLPLERGARKMRDIPPEDFDKTVEISGGFESQPDEEEAPLDDLFPPIKF